MAPVQKKQAPQKFTLDVSKPTQDGIFDVEQFKKFLNDRIKVENRTGNLDGNVLVSVAKDIVTIVVSPEVPFAKRYIKYLTKKYLKKHSLRDWLRVIASSKNGYEVRYYNITQQGDDEEEA
jgi:large subunit ribosomal protein L22e